MVPLRRGEQIEPRERQVRGGDRRGEQVGEVAGPARHRGAIEEVGAVFPVGGQRVAAETESERQVELGGPILKREG